MSSTEMDKDSSPIDTEKAIEEPPVEQHGGEHTEYPGWRKVSLIMISLYLAFFLVALDRTIIATAIPRITDDFHSLGDVGWYGSAYLLTASAFQLLYGRIYTFYSPKSVFLVAVGLFEVGSAICGAAPSSKTFIIGRAIAGLGSSGVFSGAIVIIMHTVPLHKRPIFQGLVGAIFGIASVAGPLLGGAFTTNVSWRWCFYINLPIGAVTMVILFFILNLPSPSYAGTTFREQFAQLDPLGTVCFLPSIVCLLLALQWGGTTYPWKDGRIIALFVLFGLLMVAFIAIQIWKQDTATVPPRIIRQQSIAAGFWFTTCTTGSMMAMIYYLPIWFQAIKGVDAVKSGIMALPLIISLVIASIMAGGLVTAMGYYTPFMIASAVLTSIGAGLITTFETDTGHAKWIGYQVLYGFGLGLGMQQAGLAAQTVLSKKDVPTGVALMFFGQGLGGSIFISIGENVFATKLASGLTVVGINPNKVVTAGATDLRSIVPAKYLKVVLSAYNHALTRTYIVAVALSCFALIGAAAVEWKSVKGRRQGSGAKGAGKKEEADKQT